jgi:hypothetical protein
VAVILLTCAAFAVGVSRLPAGDSPVSVPAFDANRAFGCLKKQVEFGPRYAGTAGHTLTADYIQEQLKPYADGVKVQEFSKIVRGKNLQMQNIIAHFHPGSKKQILLAAHWDSRPTADMEIDVVKKSQPIPAANDGGSGVAVLLELARMFAKQEPGVGVIMVFFDGEDYGPGTSDMFLGSKYFAQNLEDATSFGGKLLKVDYGILLDMVGDKDLTILPEQESAKLGHGDVFLSGFGPDIQDDHIQLIRAGMKCIDIIDFNYGPWHTLDDTPDQCSPKSLKIVGEVVANVVYRESAD